MDPQQGSEPGGQEGACYCGHRGPQEPPQEGYGGPRRQPGAEDPCSRGRSWFRRQMIHKSVNYTCNLQLGVLENPSPQATQPPPNVLKERKRRKRITHSCAQLRELLPTFDGRRNDMASILEMTVTYLKLAHQLAPPQQASTIATPTVDVQTFDPGNKRPNNTQREKKHKNIPSAEYGEQLKMNNPIVEEPVNVSQYFRVESAKHCKEETESWNLFPPKQDCKDERCPSASFAYTYDQNLHDEHILPLDSSLTKASRCSLSCDSHDQFDVLATPPQQSPLLSSSSHPWLIRNSGCHFRSSSPLPTLNCPAQGGLMTPMTNSRLQVFPHLRDGIPFLTCNESMDWMVEQEQRQYVKLQDDDSVTREGLHSFRAAAQKTVPLINDQRFVPEEPAKHLQQTFKDSSDDLVEAWKPSCSLDLVYRNDIDMSFADCFF